MPHKMLLLCVLLKVTEKMTSTRVNKLVEDPKHLKSEPEISEKYFF